MLATIEQQRQECERLMSLHCPYTENSCLQPFLTNDDGK